MGFRVSFFLFDFSIAINFLHAYIEDYFVATARNAWVGNLVCFCVMENMICTELWMVEGVDALKKGLCN
jgi:hypothetical protein